VAHRGLIALEWNQSGMTNEGICEAIQKERKLLFHYDGHRRRIQPYVHGWDSEGEEMFKGYQTDGDSESWTGPHWRTFKLDEISRLQLTDEPFTRKRDDYNPEAPQFETVHCKYDS
jgi:predicted DNA-binding transcriptional regulator YafY